MVFDAAESAADQGRNHGAPGVETGDRGPRDLGGVVGPSQRDQGLRVPTAGEGVGGACVERTALRREGDDAAGRQLGAVRGVDRDEVALGLGVAGDEAGDSTRRAARAPRRLRCARADRERRARARCRCRGRVPTTCNSTIVGRDFAEPLRALQRVREQVDVFFVGVHGASREQIEERVDALDRFDGSIACTRPAHSSGVRREVAHAA